MRKPKPERQDKAKPVAFVRYVSRLGWASTRVVTAVGQANEETIEAVRRLVRNRMI